MTAFVFTGPTLSHAEAREHLDATYLPPASQGDVYRAARTGPEAIGIVDGYFDTLPAIWHKEILWAMNEGIPVFGSASIGALRAAELAAFGMRGVGEIFEAFRSGALEDDDEVTLVHEPEGSGFRALSVPMVDIRATLKSAVEAGVISAGTHDALVGRAKRAFYPDRSYRRLIAEGAQGHRGELEALAAWLPQGRVEAKRRDAVEMLRAMKEHLARGERQEPEVRGRFHFEHTTYWDGLRTRCDAMPVGVFARPAASHGVLDEIRIGGGFDALRARAVNRALSRAKGEREGHAVDDARLARAAEELRQQKGLADAATFQRWLAAHDLDAEGLANLLEGDAASRWAMSEAEIERHALGEAKLGDDYPALRERALAKEAALAAAGVPEPGLATTGVTKEELVVWFFDEVAKRGVPGDLGGYVRGAGFEDEGHFVRVAVREYLFRRTAG